MLGKLIKYEFKATSRFMLLLYGLLTAVSVLMALMFRFNLNGNGEFHVGTVYGNVSFGGSSFLEIIAALIVIAYIFLAAAAVSAMFFYAILRFRDNLLGHEGYLMHTLPVKERDNILAKGIVSVVWTMAGIAVTLLSCLIVAFGVAGMKFFTDLSLLLRNVDGMLVMKSVRFILICIQLVLLTAAELMNGYLHIYASMAVGYSLNKHRAVASIGVFIVLNIIEGALHGTLSNIISAVSGSSMNFNDVFMFGTGNMIMLAETLFTAAVGSGFYFITKYFMTSRLNLQ